jgi:FolB domain-containing protein
MTGVDFVEIEALRLRCVLGVTEEERRDRQDVVISMQIGVDTRAAAGSDRIEDAWNYRTAAKAVIALVEDSAFCTVEALAERIARLVVLQHHAPRARVRVHKPTALRFADSVGVLIERTGDEFTDIPKEVPCIATARATPPC